MLCLWHLAGGARAPRARIYCLVSSQVPAAPAPSTPRFSPRSGSSSTQHSSSSSFSSSLRSSPWCLLLQPLLLSSLQAGRSSRNAPGLSRILTGFMPRDTNPESVRHRKIGWYFETGTLASGESDAATYVPKSERRGGRLLQVVSWRGARLRRMREPAAVSAHSGRMLTLVLLILTDCVCVCVCASVLLCTCSRPAPAETLTFKHRALDHGCRRRTGYRRATPASQPPRRTMPCPLAIKSLHL